MKRLRRGLPREVFLSHSSHDRKFADRLIEVLRRHGVPYWYSPRHIRGAQQWHDEIGEALARCDWFVVLLSPDSVKSDWVKREFLYALNQPRYKNRILPCICKPCDSSKLSWTVASTFQTIDLKSDIELGFSELLKVWGLAYQPKSGKRNPTLK